MQQKQPQNPMAAEPVPWLLACIGAPIVVSMILQAAYNVVDSAYLARMAPGSSCLPSRWRGCSRCLLPPMPCAWTACVSFRWAFCLLGCASRSRGCFRRWNAVWSHL